MYFLFHPNAWVSDLYPQTPPLGIQGVHVKNTVLIHGEFLNLFAKDDPHSQDDILPWLIPVHLEVMTHNSCFRPQTNQYCKEVFALVFFPILLPSKGNTGKSAKECIFKRKEKNLNYVPKKKTILLMLGSITACQNIQQPERLHKFLWQSVIVQSIPQFILIYKHFPYTSCVLQGKCRANCAGQMQQHEFTCTCFKDYKY